VSELQELSDLVLQIYDTAIDPGRWPDVLERIAHYVGARGAFIFELQGLGTSQRIYAPFFSTSYDPDLVRAYLQKHNQQEVADQEIFARLSRRTDRIQLIGDDALADTEEELVARPNVQEMMRNGLRYRAGALLNKDVVNHDRFALQFSKRGGPISAEQSQRAELVLPHIAKALNVSRPTTELALKFRTVADCLDQLVIGICILDSNGSIVFSNHEFNRQMDWHTVFRKDSTGKLVMRSDQAQRAMSHLREDTGNHGRFGARPRKEAIISDVGGEAHTLCVEVIPLHSAGEFGETSLDGHIIYSMDTGNSYKIDAPVLANMFELTQAEASVLELMADGLTNAQISERRAKSIETVNSQVKSVLIKTGTANRTQAIRLATNISSSFVLEPSHPYG
jgi:DNA-binding CsgD family transcriptional regulator